MIGQITFPAMGCQVMAVLDTPDPLAIDALREVPWWFKAWEQRFSRFRPDSELSWVNRQAGEPVRVSPEFAEVFELACTAAAWTGGLVTPAVHDALRAAGYQRSFQDLPVNAQPGNTWQAVPLMDSIRWDPERKVLKLPAGMHLDFGGSAKGWAAEQAVRRLEAFGEALVDAGGDIAMSNLMPSSQPGSSFTRRREPWRVGIAAPGEADELMTTLALWSGGVATSGRDRRRWKQGVAWRHHLIDPRTGRPAVTDVLIATVIAPSLSEAEAAAKCLLIAGSRNGMDWLDRNPQLAALLILETGSVVTSPNFPDYQWKELEHKCQTGSAR